MAEANNIMAVGPGGSWHKRVRRRKVGVIAPKIKMKNSLLNLHVYKKLGLFFFSK